MKNLPVIICSAAVLIVAVVAAAWSGPDSDSPSLSTLAEETSEGGSDVPAGGSAPYRSSVVGTDFDFITENDPSAFDRLEFLGLQEFEMPDKRDNNEPLVQKAYVFEAHFTDGRKIKIALDQEFGSKEAAERDAARYGPRLGKLPPLYRKIIKHITVNFAGTDTTAFAEDKGHFFTIYSGNASKRIGTHDLEETFFHEGTHASIQEAYLESSEWKSAVSRDGAYITDYAKTSEQEDFAESALFAYTIIYHPERFPDSEREKIKKTIPNRIAFFRRVFSGEAEMGADSSEGA
ncbi:MAG: hypothetical protein H2055_02315 [Sphingopyxis sp.]|nr:hypothetical protein [Sphingopyxis sp.]